MLAIAVSNETKPKLYETYKPVKRILSVLAKESLIGKRLIEAFGTDDKAFIAEKLGFSSVQAVYKVLNGDRELDFEKLQNFRNYTKRSIDWLLTGQEELPVKDPDESPIELRIRQIVRDELAAALPLQDLGTVDEFDIASAVEKYDNAVPVLRDWYAHDKLPMPPDLPAEIRFAGWDRKTIEQKVKEVTAVRRSIEQERSLKDVLKASHAARTPKKKI